MKCLLTQTHLQISFISGNCVYEEHILEKKNHNQLTRHCDKKIAHTIYEFTVAQSHNAIIIKRALLSAIIWFTTDTCNVSGGAGEAQKRIPNDEQLTIHHYWSNYFRVFYNQ